MMKKWIIMSIPMVMILLSSMAMATVTRTGSGDQVTYSSTIGGSYTKAYWAVDETTSCSISGVSCSVGICEYTGNSIRVVANTPDGGGTLPSSITVTISGSGSCTLDNGQYVESTPGNTGSAQSITGSETLDLDGGASCNTDADKNCDNKVSDSELLIHMGEWKAEHRTVNCDSTPGCVSDQKLLASMNAWKNTHRL